MQISSVLTVLLDLNKFTPLIEEIASVTNLPISCQPNAGMPQLINKQTVFPLTAEEMGPLMLPIVDAGASYVGGCCGTTPAHIQSISDAVKAHTHLKNVLI